MDPSTPLSSIPPQTVAMLAAEDQGPKTIGLVVTFTALAFLVVCLRFYARVRFAIQIGWEDYFSAISIVFSILCAVCQIMQVKQGFGKHQIFVDLPHTIAGLRWWYCSIICYCISFTFIKVSILTQYRRIFSVDTTPTMIYIVGAICVLGGIAALFTFAFGCIPVDAFWNLLKKPTAKCINSESAQYAHGSINTVTDLMIAALPVRAIWRLHLMRRQKIALVFILSIGWLVCIVSIVRIVSLYIFSQHPQDPTYWSAPPIYWACIEMNLGLVCGCAPSLKPIAVRIVPGFASHVTTNRSGEQSYARRSKLMSVGRSFQKLNGTGSMHARNLQTDHGTELDAVPSPTMPSLEKYDTKNIVVTHDVDQRSDRRTSDGSSRSLVLQGQLSRV